MYLYITYYIYNKNIYIPTFYIYIHTYIYTYIIYTVEQGYNEQALD